VIRVSIIDRNLLTGFDVSEREEQHLLARHLTHVGVGRARVIDEGGRVAANFGINGQRIVTEADDLNSSRRHLRTTPRGDPSPTPEEFTGVGGDLLPFLEGDKGKASLSPNRTRSNFECLQSLGKESA